MLISFLFWIFFFNSRTERVGKRFVHVTNFLEPRCQALAESWKYFNIRATPLLTGLAAVQLKTQTLASAPCVKLHTEKPRMEKRVERLVTNSGFVVVLANRLVFPVAVKMLKWKLVVCTIKKTFYHGATDSLWISFSWIERDSWILAEFFFCAFMDREKVEVHKNVKKERG